MGLRCCSRRLVVHRGESAVLSQATAVSGERSTPARQLALETGRHGDPADHRRPSRSMHRGSSAGAGDLNGKAVELGRDQRARGGGHRWLERAHRSKVGDGGGHNSNIPGLKIQTRSRKANQRRRIKSLTEVDRGDFDQVRPCRGKTGTTMELCRARVINEGWRHWVIDGPVMEAAPSGGGEGDDGDLAGAGSVRGSRLRTVVSTVRESSGGSGRA